MDRRALAEAAGTFVLVFVGPGAVAATASDASFGHLIMIAGVFAATVAFVAFVVGRLSGAFINPAVTVAAVVARRLAPRDAVAFVVAQTAGGLLGGIALLLFFDPGSASGHLGSTALAPSITPAVGAGLEIAGTFGLSMAALQAHRLAKKGGAQIAIVATVLFVVIVAIGPSTGASLNPARSLGPAAASMFWENILLYLIAPTAGGVLAGVVSRGRRPPPA